MAGRLWWLITLPLALIGAGLMADWRWAVVGLMLLFIVYPMVMTMVILRYTAHPSMARRSTAEAIEFTGDDMLRILKIERHEDTDDVRFVEIERCPVVRTEFRRAMVVVTVGPAVTDFLLIPRKSLNQDQLILLAKKETTY
ncbi:MAG: hypothetical protein K2M19_00510 [Muribaculaceae bacterium]|nr:hypothetical protein [Muribaculaceae bacterium]